MNIRSSGPIRRAQLEALPPPEVKKAIADAKTILTTRRGMKQRLDAVE